VRQDQVHVGVACGDTRPDDVDHGACRVHRVLDQRAWTAAADEVESGGI
jgi:hypothetical protein